MTVYKNFLRLVWTRKVSTMIYVVIFLFISFMTLKSQNSQVSEFAETPLTINIIDRDGSELSKHLISYLQSKHDVYIIDEKDKTNEEILRELKKGISLQRIHAGLIINENMEENVTKGKKALISFKDDRKKSGFYIDLQVNMYLAFAASVKKAQGNFDFQKIEDALKVNTKVNKVNFQKNISVNIWFKIFFNFLGWIVFSVILNSVGWAMFELNNERLKMRNNISPLSTLRFVCENFLAQLTVVVAILSILIGFAVITNITRLDNIPLLFYIFNALIYTAVILSLTFMFNSFLKKGSVMGIVGSVLPLSLAFISGVFVEQELLPDFIVNISRLFPTYYYISANEFTQVNLSIDWKSIGMLFLFLLLYFTIGTYFSKLGRSQSRIEFTQQ
ncbi:ABC transporter permease [Treponema sp. OMZ 792]|uniref:ABC transporter permease n=1 Tax=unclassified Treponema TaxID=2638727 RepID=UPI0020A34916|nr:MULTISPECIES: ABC transporter permease [unclassified Treponema]UTC75264.1 ABC transporter permease [Treponema sp. OMZ 792]UTC79269.1 ABC transporter permease [Treponema sp. OMZ 798]